MNYNKKTKLYEASNVWYDPKLIKAVSYDWWIFVDKIKGKILFNDYRYSNTTARHQYKVLNLMLEMNIIPDLRVEAPDGLQDLHGAIQRHLSLITKLQSAIANPRSRKSVNAKRQAEIDMHRNKISFLQKLL